MTAALNAVITPYVAALFSANWGPLTLIATVAVCIGIPVVAWLLVLRRHPRHSAPLPVFVDLALAAADFDAWAKELREGSKQ